jgi:hypothetical protein
MGKLNLILEGLLVAVVVCPRCRHKNSAPDEFVGRVLRCPSCKTTFPARGAAINSFDGLLFEPLDGEQPMAANNSFDGLLFEPLDRERPVVAISCPSCSRKREVPARFVGQKVRCPTCRARFLAQPAASNRSGERVSEAPDRPQGNPSERQEPANQAGERAAARPNRTVVCIVGAAALLALLGATWHARDHKSRAELETGFKDKLIRYGWTNIVLDPTPENPLCGQASKDGLTYRFTLSSEHPGVTVVSPHNPIYGYFDGAQLTWRPEPGNTISGHDLDHARSLAHELVVAYDASH